MRSTVRAVGKIVKFRCGGSRQKLARPLGLEPRTLCLEGRCSIQLSYGRN